MLPSPLSHSSFLSTDGAPGFGDSIINAPAPPKESSGTAQRFTCYLLPPSDHPAILEKEESRRARTWRWLRHPFHSYYEHTGKKHVARYTERYSQALLKEDGSIDRRARAALHQALEDKLLEKEQHFVKEGIKYLQIYAGTAVILIGVIAAGTLITSSASSGGVGAPITIAAVGVAVGTAVIGAGVTSGLIAYRIDSLRKHQLKGLAEVLVHGYEREVLQQRQRQVAELIAQLAIALVVEELEPMIPDRCEMAPRKHREICEVIVESMVHNEIETGYLNAWMEVLSTETARVMEEGPSELLKARREARESALAECDFAELDLAEEEKEILRKETAREVDYLVAKLWVSRQVLTAAAQKLTPHIRPHLSIEKERPYVIRTHATRCIKDLKKNMEGVPRSHDAAILRLETLHNRDRQKIKDLSTELMRVNAQRELDRKRLELLEDRLLQVENGVRQVVP